MPPLRNQLQPVIDRAIALHQVGRIVDAEAMYRQVLQRDPANPDALHLLGLIYHHNGQPEPAIELMSRAVREEPNLALYRINLAKAYRAAGRWEEAVASARRATDLAPPAQAADARVELSACLRTVGKSDEAERHARDAVARDSNRGDVFSALGNALSDQGRYDDAVAAYDVALRYAAARGEAASNVGEVFRKLGRYAEAEQWLREAIRLTPQVGEPHLNLALTLLVQGRFDEGWHEYEWRWRQIGHAPPASTKPTWDGSPLAGRTILLHTEQGFGDSIQFARYIPLLRDVKGAGRIILACEGPLMALLRTLGGVSEVVEKSAAYPSFDVHCALASLPHRFQTNLATIPNRVPYVSCDPHRAETWRQSLGLARDVRNVGVVWAGSGIHKNDRNRSCRLDEFAPLADVPNVRLFSLQVGPPGDQLRSAPSGLRIENVGSGLTDFADTAAVMAELDLIISVDTSPAHLAGALAKPVWVLVPYVPDFRWLLDRSDSPWYPTMRLFRQPNVGDWGSVIAEVRAALQATSP